MLLPGDNNRPQPPAGGCTARTPRCIDARDYNVELRECCRGHVRRIMRDLTDAMTAARITWWADYGTLLGAVRNPLTMWADYPWLRQDGRTTPGPAPGIVPHDKDGDLGALFSDFPKFRLLRTRLAERGYSTQLNGIRGSAKVFLSARNHTNVDVFFWRVRKGGMLYRSSYAQVDEHKGKEFNIEHIQPRGEVEFEGMKLQAPNNVEQFLEMRYGPTWRRPLPANFDANYHGVGK